MVKLTKWKRLRRRKQRLRAEKTLTSKDEEKEVKLTEPENISENIQQSQEIEKLENTETDPGWDIKTPSLELKTILTQIPRYVYLAAIFALLAGVFYPLITPGIPIDLVIQGTAILFLGLAGAILLFKAVTSDKRRGIFIGVGFALITISLILIYQLQEYAHSSGFV